MKITIRKANEKDFSSILSLIKELAAFEKTSEKITNSVKQMEEEKYLFDCFVAETEKNEIIGIALYFYIYHAWVGKSLYLAELYVKESFRGKKIGTNLLKKIFKTAKKENCKMIRWQVLNWNKSAINMYKKYGAVINNEWNNCDFDLQKIKKL
jgi:predicted N-acetyltransferase YhbS